MIAYTTIGTNDVERAVGFYDAIFEGRGVRKLFKGPSGGQFYGKGPGQPLLAVTPPYDKERATAGNGTMVALQCESTEEVDAIHRAALDAGGQDEGAPGWRLPNVFYGGYFRDLDGNKLCACVMRAGG